MVPATRKASDASAVTDPWGSFGKAGGQGRAGEPEQPKSFFCIA